MRSERAPDFRAVMGDQVSIAKGIATLQELTGMGAQRELSETLKQQRELAAFYEGRVRDLGTPIVQAWQTIPLLFSVLALLTAGKVFSADQLPLALFVATMVGVGLAFVVRATHERRAVRVREEYEQEHQLLFGEPPRIELIGFALPARRPRTKSL